MTADPPHDQSITQEAKPTFKDRVLGKLDAYQQRHAIIGFPYGVIKKYSDDEAGYEAALITYYGFLSLFPLLVVAMSITQLSLLHNSGLKDKIIRSLNHNFPLVGSQLQNNTHATAKAGVALAISLLITIYGSRGIATAVQHAMNHVWQVPRFKRGGFKNKLESIAIVLLIGIGFIGSGFLSSLASYHNFNSGLKIAAIAASLVLSFVTIISIIKLAVSAKQKIKEFIVGAIAATIGFQIIQALGGILITHELKHFGALYGTFAVILALLFWIYLQARIFLYASEINSVKSLSLWPRSLTGERLTEQDQKAYRLYARRERFKEKERVQINVETN